MNELLAPAGTLEAFKAAINNGANAIYLGLDKFSARAYATNFTLENLKPLIEYAHLRNVKIYVTINTIIYDDELDEVYSCIDELASINVDAIIVQDLAILTYIANKYSSIKAHASTQMGIDDVDGATIVKELGATRIVLARETSLETIKKIKKDVNVELEVFIHGALCVSYSGNCLMSSMLGERSGNRGRCAGCCRKPYSLTNRDTNKEINKSYILSMKDLNVADYIKQMSFIDSFKIEGRMKEPSYVASVTKLYRQILDNENYKKSDFCKVFNRTYTKGFINNESNGEVTNINKPNNNGYLIGEVYKVEKNKIFIKLYSNLSKGDQIRIENERIFEEISIPVTKMFDESGNEIFFSDTVAAIYTDKKVKIGDKVFKTKDISFVKEAEDSLSLQAYKKLPLKMVFNAKENEPINLEISYKDVKCSVSSDFICERAKKTSISKQNIESQLNKLNDTPYYLNNIEIHLEDGLFFPLKTLNELRRLTLEKLNNKRLEFQIQFNDQKNNLGIPKFEEQIPEITAEVQDLEQYEKVKELGIKHIYYKNIVRRNNPNYIDCDDEILVGGLGALNHYKSKSNIVTDYSFNVTNFQTVAILHSLGAQRITLSQEINNSHIKNLIENYKEHFNTNPNLELIVYGRTKLMHMKYCPLKRVGLCGECKKSKFDLKDNFSSFPLQFNDDCSVTVLNDKTLNILPDLKNLKGINYYRLVFTTENPAEIEQIVKKARESLINKNTKNIFNFNKDTHGHFYNNPL